MCVCVVFGRDVWDFLMMMNDDHYYFMFVFDGVFLMMMMMMLIFGMCVFRIKICESCCGGWEMTLAAYYTLLPAGTIVLMMRRTMMKDDGS